MVKAPIPENEAERLENLESYRLLDTPFEAVFDEVASLAGKICGVPYALISLVDRKRQWFKATYGWKGPRESERDISFCGHAIVQEDILHVPDATLDERFHDNPFVTGELGIRVYAGVPLVSEEGHKLGTLCVLSDKPTRLDTWQVESLKQLSRVIGVLFKARREERHLQMMSRVLDELPDEILLADTKSLRGIYANAAALRSAGLASGRVGRLRLDRMLGKAAASRHEAALLSLREGAAPRVIVEVERASAGESGQPGTLEVRMQRLRAAETDTIVAVGHDISERKEAERARAMLQEELSSRNRELSQAYGQLHAEMAVAQETQKQFLPLPQCIGKACFDWLFLASSYLSGDIFDYFSLDDRYVCFHVTDVSGHGVSAALLGFTVQRLIYAAKSDMLFLLHSCEEDLRTTAAAVASEVNRKFFATNRTGMYLTMVYGLLDTETGRAALVQAGHPYPLLTHAHEQGVQVLGRGGLPIGILENAEYEAVSVELRPASRLYLYSDGISEAVNAEGREFGHDGLASVVERMGQASLPEIKSAVEAAILNWQDGTGEIKDDMTFVVLEFDNRL
ncbi:SpoIIE family protein phosphatase [Noviherbaspirillum pedocola]|uniref:SpoIIE family protein phosphatase n=1 Tax=Noviherbaspirillum pedocola TaxID=2801341 RepID=A0A934SRH2_9BURK|nr:SpoIIE family protein phosphatase [Noviherbaspirillum pedocola]MBK4735406.1 SpoIIE family protein phosphatase [Noviherbaspirillum pedocola]